MNIRIGQGWDRHELINGDGIIIAGVRIPCTKASKAHSDGDVLIHAIIDALLGASANGDIGSHFPNSDPSFKNIDSKKLLAHVVDLLWGQSQRIINIDTTIVLEAPKLRNYINVMRETLAPILKIDISNISIKAKTAEKCDAVGEGRAIEAQAIVLIEKLMETE